LSEFRAARSHFLANFGVKFVMAANAPRRLQIVSTQATDQTRQPPWRADIAESRPSTFAIERVFDVSHREIEVDQFVEGLPLAATPLWRRPAYVQYFRAARAIAVDRTRMLAFANLL
jgi:hypothetical protein